MTLSELRSALGIIQPKGYIDGLHLDFNDGETLLVKSGECFIPGSDQLLQTNTAIPFTVPDVADSWLYVYTYLDSGVPSVEVSSVSPDAPYVGTAMTKLGDTTRRLVGAIKTDADGSVLGFDILPGNFVMWRTMGSSNPNRIIASGTSTELTRVDVSSFLPSYARNVYVRAQNNTTDTMSAVLFKGDATAADLTNSDNADLVLVHGTIAIYGFVRTDEQQNIAYAASGIGTGSPSVNVWVRGYSFDR